MGREGDHIFSENPAKKKEREKIKLEKDDFATR